MKLSPKQIQDRILTILVITLFAVALLGLLVLFGMLLAELPQK